MGYYVEEVDGIYSMAGVQTRFIILDKASQNHLANDLLYHAVRWKRFKAFLLSALYLSNNKI